MHRATHPRRFATFAARTLATAAAGLCTHAAALAALLDAPAAPATPAPLRSPLEAAVLAQMGEQGALRQRSTTTTVTVRIRWARNVRHASELCKDQGLKYGASACAWGTTSECNVVAVEPDSFYDIRALAVLGHEVWHCLGAKHD